MKNPNTQENSLAKHYYSLGSDYAATQTKLAAFGPFKLRNALSTPLAVFGAMGAGAGLGAAAAKSGLRHLPVFEKGIAALEDSALHHGISMHYNPKGHAIEDAIRQLAIDSSELSLAAAQGVGAIGGGALALAGAKKLLNKHNPIERYLDLGLINIPLGKARI